MLARVVWENMYVRMNCESTSVLWIYSSNTEVPRGRDEVLISSVIDLLPTDFKIKQVLLHTFLLPFARGICLLLNEYFELAMMVMTEGHR